MDLQKETLLTIKDIPIYMSCVVLQNEKMLQLRIYYIREKQNCTTIVQPVNLLTVEKKRVKIP